MTKIAIVVSVLMLAAVACTALTAANQTATGQEQQFNITTTQGGGQADITVSLNPGPGNVTVITEDNSTTLENVTAEPVVNSTGDDIGVIVVPENSTVTQVDNQTTVVTTPEEPCACPPAEAAPEDTGLAPVIVTPAPGQEVIAQNGTELIANETQEEPIPIPAPEPAPAPTNDTGAVEPAPEPAPAPANETGQPISNDTGIVITPAPEPEQPGNATGGNETGGNVTGTSFMAIPPFVWTQNI